MLNFRDIKIRHEKELDKVRVKQTIEILQMIKPIFRKFFSLQPKITSLDISMGTWCARGEFKFKGDYYEAEDFERVLLDEEHFRGKVPKIYKQIIDIAEHLLETDGNLFIIPNGIQCLVDNQEEAENLAKNGFYKEAIDQGINVEFKKRSEIT